jgi:hypothetical protein
MTRIGYKYLKNNAGRGLFDLGSNGKAIPGPKQE